MSGTTEAFARVRIDVLLHEAGWKSTVTCRWPPPTRRSVDHDYRIEFVKVLLDQISHCYLELIDDVATGIDKTHMVTIINDYSKRSPSLAYRVSPIRSGRPVPCVVEFDDQCGHKT